MSQSLIFVKSFIFALKPPLFYLRFLSHTSETGGFPQIFSVEVASVHRTKPDIPHVGSSYHKGGTGDMKMLKGRRGAPSPRVH